jgi:hypothetical protein
VTPKRFSKPFFVVYALTGTVLGVSIVFSAVLGYYFGFTFLGSSLGFGDSFTSCYLCLNSGTSCLLP